MAIQGWSSTAFVNFDDGMARRNNTKSTPLYIPRKKEQYIATSIPKNILLGRLCSNRGSTAMMYWYGDFKSLLVKSVQFSLDNRIKHGNGPEVALALHTITVYKCCIDDNDVITLSEDEPFADLLPH